MEWKNPIDDPIPALLMEAYALEMTMDTNPCSVCRNHTQKFVKGTPVLPRTHFHASDIGACKRKTLYRMRNPGTKGLSSPEFLRDGHVHEREMLWTMIEGFNRMGNNSPLGKVTIYPAENKEEHIARIPYTEEETEDIQEFRIIAHFDGLLAFDKDVMESHVYLIECKSVKQDKWDSIRSGEMDKEWYGQIQGYLRMLSVQRAYLLVKNRATSQFHTPIRIDFDSNYLKERREALTEVHKALRHGTQVDREHTKKTDSECKWCPFYDGCWKGEPIERDNVKLEALVSITETQPALSESQEKSIYED